MTKAPSQDFQPYLQSICAAPRYKYWWSHYTLTDVVGKRSPKHEESKQEEISSPFDFGLMVQAVQPQQEEKRQEQEKKERLPVLEGIRKYAEKHVLLVGKPGSGKSTALIRLLLEEAQQKNTHLNSSFPSQARSSKIPILIDLRYFRPPTEVIERIEAFFYQHAPNLEIDRATLKTWLRQGKFLLLFDGLNELSSEQARQKLRIFREDYRQTPMIFTTRDVSLGGNLDINNLLEMQPLTEKQMRDFVKAYLPEKGEQMLRQLRDRLREFSQTPLLLWMLCELFRQTGNVPSNLGLVFKLFTQGYEGRLKKDVPVSEDSRRWWSQLLQHLAFEMMQGEKPTDFRVAISKQEAQTVLSEFLQGKAPYPNDLALRCLDELLKYHLIQIGSGNQIEFRHQLFQEYYAAEYLLKKLPYLSDERLKHDYLNYLKWTEPLALMLALEDKEHQVRKIVKLALKVDLKLGARLAGAVLPKFQAQTLGLIPWGKIPQRLKVELLGSTYSEQAVSPLIQALKDLDSSVRWNAIEALGEIGSETAIPGLIDALNDQDEDVRSRTIKALGKSGNPESLTCLWELQLTSSETYISSAISEIQARCQFYNYEIFQSSLIEQEDITNQTFDKASITYIQQVRVIKMPNSGEKKIDFSGASIGGVNIDSTVHGDQIGTQHQYAPEQKQSLAEAAAEIQQLLEQLAQTNPTIVQAKNQDVVVEAIEQEIKSNPDIKTRLLSALKAGGTEALTQALEAIFKNPLVSIPVETIKGFIEAE
ncbi:MAG: HEAT repeat domain-containing protein [Xenococcus sp. MO_188.B8]|nr:HEAT repeat domain-containing protein [Xenococcus sp. MO_188.B8]